MIDLRLLPWVSKTSYLCEHIPLNIFDLSHQSSSKFKFKDSPEICLTFSFLLFVDIYILMLLTFEKTSAKTDPWCVCVGDSQEYVVFLVTAELPIDNMSFKTCMFVFKISPKTPKMASFLTEELPDDDNYRILINYKFWSSLMSYININEWMLYTKICSFVISREKSEKNYKIGLLCNDCELIRYLQLLQ